MRRSPIVQAPGIVIQLVLVLMLREPLNKREWFGRTMHAVHMGLCRTAGMQRKAQQLKPVVPL